MDKLDTRAGFVWRRVGLLCAAVVVAPAALVLAIQEPEVLSVDDPRPLAEAVKLIEQRCHCAITYEDPKWGPEDVVDISGSVWHRADIRPRVPKGGHFTFSLPRDVSARTAGGMRAPVEQVLRTFESSGSGPGAFRLISDNTALHVVPRSGSVLDVPVTIAPGTRPIIELVAMTMEQVGQAIGLKVGIATLPTNLLKRPVTLEARQEPARVVLSRALLASGRSLSWRLFYDVTMGQYYLGIHFVPYQP
jgi:hypothetical protein